MANANFDSTAMTSKVLSLIVAIVVFACVLVPVVGSMANGGDSGGGGAITYTNVGDYYYKSATTDSDEHLMEVTHYIHYNEDSTDTIELTVVVDGNEVYSNIFENVNDDYYEFATPIVLAYSDDGYLVNYGGYCRWEINSDTLPTVCYNMLPDSEEFDDDSATTVTNLRISNGTLSYTDRETNSPNTIAIEYYMAEDGEYVLADSNVKVAKSDTTIYVNYSLYMTSETSEMLMYYRIIGQFDSSNITSSELDMQGYLHIGGVTWVNISNPQCSATLDSTIDDVGITLESINADAQLEYDGNVFNGSTTITQFFVPVTVSLSADSGSSDSGVVGTLIGIIPIFVVLGLLMFAVSKLGLLDMVKSRLE